MQLTGRHIRAPGHIHSDVNLYDAMDCQKKLAALLDRCPVGSFDTSVRTVDGDCVISAVVRDATDLKSGCFVTTETAAALVLGNLPLAAKILVYSRLMNETVFMAMSVLVGSTSNYRRMKELVDYWDANIFSHACK